MKKTFLLFSLCLITFCASAQSNGDFNYSLGVRGYNYMQMPNVLNQSNNDTYLTTYFTSYIVKFNDNLFSYRLNGSYFQRGLKFFNNCENCDLADGKMKDLSFKIGFEKSFNYSVIQPFFAFDLGYRSNKFKGVSTRVNDPGNSSAVNINATKEGLTITPTIGLKINPTDRFSIFAESNLEFFYSYERQERVNQGSPDSRSLIKYNKGEYLLNPIAVGVQIHLGAKN